MEHNSDEEEAQEYIGQFDPLVEILFNPESDLYHDVPHLQYIAAIESDKVC